MNYVCFAWLKVIKTVIITDTDLDIEESKPLNTSNVNGAQDNKGVSHLKLIVIPLIDLCLTSIEQFVQLYSRRK